MFCILASDHPRRHFWTMFAGFAAVALLILFGVLVPLLRPEVPASAPLARTDEESKILQTIDEIERADETFASVPASDGRVLRLLAEALGAQTIIEVGTSTGISGLWLCLALTRTGGQLTTFEIDPARAALARSHFQRAGVDRLVRIVEGDAHGNLAHWTSPVDLAFLDADKNGYEDYLNQLLPRLRPGGVILAHNARMVPEYIAAITRNPAMETVFYMRGGGLVVTMKKR